MTNVPVVFAIIPLLALTCTPVVLDTKPLLATIDIVPVDVIVPPVIPLPVATEDTPTNGVSQYGEVPFDVST